MDIRQVALGAALGAAMAVNAALQSLQDTGSFLIRTPDSSRNAVDLPGATVDARTRRALSFEDEEEEFLEFENVDDELPGITLQNSDLGGSPITSPQPEGAHLPQSSIEHNSETERCDPPVEQPAELGTCAKRRKTEGPLGFPVLPFAPPAAQTEEAMSLMLQQTTDTVLSTLEAAKGRRDRMLLEVGKSNAPETETSVKLVSSFIDALDNVSDSLKTVQSALFIKTNQETS
ncbi:hypothetical protein R1sor_016170 [Riccia sorocarpa]|uniref:Uncharacterized protein n=1 Tax=Riccia sorocarpa TaxID=122646 RepID=A0ABD3HIE8_9MARC